jgi:isopenicillin N synthase-like dioxygenase
MKNSKMTIPVVNLADFTSGDSKRKKIFVQELGKAFEEVGFVALKNHGIPADLIKCSTIFFSSFGEKEEF